MGGSASTLTEHWNGHAWKIVPSRNPGSNQDVLSSVSAIAPHNAWAVGFQYDGVETRTLVEHWNGHMWRLVPSPNAAGTDSELDGVAMASATNGWAAGYSHAGLTDSALMLHWNGHAWSKQPVPSFGTSDMLQAVGASSGKEAWAVGSFVDGVSQALAVHCC